MSPKQHKDDFGQLFVVTHTKSECEAPCPVHAPSKHRMSDFPQRWKKDGVSMERVCTHGYGHPDPDDKVSRLRVGPHLCDGCCMFGPARLAMKKPEEANNDKA